jgi:RNA polymerase sigma factor (sigma-70 family)
MRSFATSERVEQPEESALSADDPLPPEDRVVVPLPSVSLESLYRSETPRLVRMVARRTANRDEALDIVHDIFFRIARLGFGRSVKLDRPQAYLSRMATNMLRDRAKIAARRSLNRHVPVDEHSLPGLDPHRLLESRDMLNRLNAVMLRMRPKTREIFMAHRVDGLTYVEIADQMGISVSAVEKHISKAIAHIDRLLDWE